MEQSEFELVPIWDAIAAGRGLTRYTTGIHFYIRNIFICCCRPPHGHLAGVPCSLVHHVSQPISLTACGCACCPSWWALLNSVYHFLLPFLLREKIPYLQGLPSALDFSFWCFLWEFMELMIYITELGNKQRNKTG